MSHLFRRWRRRREWSNKWDRTPPQVDAVSGTLAAGGQIVISGSGFGSKPQAPPLKWDELEDGALGSYLTTGGYANYNSPGEQTHKYSDKVAHAGSQSALKSCLGGSWSAAGINDLALDELYLTLWFRWDSTSDENRVVKVLRVSSGSSMYNSWPGLWYTGNRMHNNHYYGIRTQDGDTHQRSLSFSGSAKNKRQWARLELHYRHSTGGSSNGLVRWWWDGQMVGEDVGVVTRLNDGAKIKNLIFPGMPDSQEGEFEFAFDDLYLDSTVARVELCAGASWDARGLCEIQLPTAWSSTSITATFNQGAIASGESRYLYVVDAQGQANAAGLPVELGTSPAVEPPTPPQSLRVIGG